MSPRNSEIFTLTVRIKERGTTKRKKNIWREAGGQVKFICFILPLDPKNGPQREKKYLERSRWAGKIHLCSYVC